MEKKNFAVLIVEKDPIVALDLQGIMLNAGHDVVASVSEAGTALIAAERFRPDVVLMGGVIDGGSAYTVAEQILQKTGCPTVFCLSPYDKNVFEATKRHPSFEIVFKPVNAEALTAILGMAVYKHTVGKSLREAEKRAACLSGAAEIWDVFCKEHLAFRWKLDAGGFSFPDLDGEPLHSFAETAAGRITAQTGPLPEGTFSFLTEPDTAPPGSAEPASAFLAVVFGVKHAEAGQGCLLFLRKNTVPMQNPEGIL